MKIRIRLGLAALALSACSASPGLRVDSDEYSMRGPGLDEAMHHRQFYENDRDSTPAWMKATAQPNR